MNKVYFIELPSGFFSFPVSPALPLLKAVLEQQKIQSTIFYTDLEFLLLYEDFMDDKFASERFLDRFFVNMLFARLYDQDDNDTKERSRKYIKNVLKDKRLEFLDSDVIACEKMLLGVVKRAVDKFISSFDSNIYKLISFSVSYHDQLIACLYFSKCLKRSYPHIPILLGGSNFSAESARGVLTLFKDVDFVLIGEGEKSILEIWKSVIGARGNLQEIKGLVWRKDKDVILNEKQKKFINMNNLPIGNYDDYFRKLNEFEKKINIKNVIPRVVTVEMSRGCWWRKCAFCAYSCVSGYDFRKKEVSRFFRECNFLKTRWRVDAFYFTDEVFSRETLKSVFDDTRVNRYKFFRVELKSSVTKDELCLLKGRVLIIQVGIESLCTSLLKKMNKGALAIQNIQIMKWFEEFGLKSASNLMLDYPLESQSETEQTIRRIDLIKCYQPLNITYFKVLSGSRIFAEKEKYKIVGLYPHALCLPKKKAGLFAKYHFQFRYVSAVKSEKMREKQLDKMEKAIKEWNKFYAAVPDSLTYIKEKDSIVIQDLRYGKIKRVFILKSIKYNMYIYCDSYKDFKSIRKNFSNYSSKEIKSVLNFFVRKKLMFHERVKGKNLYLSLAYCQDREREILPVNQEKY